MKFTWMCTLVTLVIGGALESWAQPPASAAGFTASVNTLVGLMQDSQRTQMLIPFDSGERLKWHFIPKTRKGLPLKSMTAPQQEAALAVLREGLSLKGFDKIETIRRLEVVLRDELRSMPMMRDPENYYIIVFGQPSEEGAWGLRYEGHHISLNWTIVDGTLAANTPSFLGATPARVLEGSMKGTRVLGTEEDLARKLMNSLDEDQREKALTSDRAPGDILTRNNPKIGPLPDKGIGYQQLDPSQQATLLALIEEILGTQPPGVAHAKLERIRDAKLENLKFDWQGSLEMGKGHYYRIQGPTFLFEYDNVQNRANHVHTVWREFDRDFGADLLKDHYQVSHNPNHGGLFPDHVKIPE